MLYPRPMQTEPTRPSSFRPLSTLALILSLTVACSAPNNETAPEAASGPEPTATAEPGAVADSDLPEGCNPDSPCPGSTCPASITSALATIPTDACPRFGEFQSDVDVYSWNTFIALNWPADTATCAANTDASILDSKGPVVWETFALDSNVFVAEGSQPSPYCNANLDYAAPRSFDDLRKVSDELDENFPDFNEAFGAGPLTDLNGRFVRFEKRLNQDEYNYLIDNTLWSKAGQQGKTVSFPDGDPSNTSCNGGPCGTLGAMEIKAAWKVLSDEEVASGRFYMTQGTVYNNAEQEPSPGKNPVTLGLVGLHFIHKTQTQSTWFWSTFEQVDNVTANDGHGPNFNQPNCTDCAPDNTQTAKQPYTELASDGTPLNQPAQVTRVNSLLDDLPSLNAYYQGLLAGSVWQYYELIGTQWATGGAPQGTPSLLANTTIETFFQSSSSCLGCHTGAQTTAGNSADFSFLMGEAQ